MFRHGRFDQSGRQCVYANSLARIFDRSCLRQANDSVFCSHIRAYAALGDQSGNRRVIDNRAAAYLQHLLNFVFHCEKYSLHIHCKGLVESRFFPVSQRCHRWQNAGVVKGAMQSTESFDRSSNEVFHLLGVPHIGLHQIASPFWYLIVFTVSTPAGLMSPMTSFAPCRANRSDVARPMPLVPPVTSATLFVKSNGLFGVTSKRLGRSDDRLFRKNPRILRVE